MEEIIEDHPESQGALRTVKDLTAGAVGGVAQVLLGRLLFSSMSILTYMERCYSRSGRHSAFSDAAVYPESRLEFFCVTRRVI